MPLDANQIALSISSDVQRSQAAAQLQAMVAMSPQVAAQPMAAGSNEFCRIWPSAKPILELLAGVVAFIPGAGVTAGTVLRGLIKVGDQISAEVCQ
jgi:hypothetical protein